MSDISIEKLLVLYKDEARIKITGRHLNRISDKLQQLTDENIKLVKENKNIKDKSKVLFVSTSINPNYTLRNRGLGDYEFTRIETLLILGSIEILTEYNDTSSTIEYFHLDNLEKKLNEYYNKKLIDIELKNNNNLNAIKKDYDYELNSIKEDIKQIEKYKLQIKELKIQLSKEKTTIDIMTEQYGELLDESKAYCAKAEFYENRGFWSRLFNIKYKDES